MWRDDALILDMLLAAEQARQFNHDKSWEQFASDRMLQAATQYELQIIGDAASKVSTEFKAQHAEIPWNKIIAFRHRLVHDYPRIELPKVGAIVQEHVGPIIDALKRIVRPEDN